VREVELRRLDRVRTAAFVGAVAAAAIGVVAWQIGDGNANDDVPPGANPERRRGPVVVLRLPYAFSTRVRAAGDAPAGAPKNETEGDRRLPAALVLRPLPFAYGWSGTFGFVCRSFSGMS